MIEGEVRANQYEWQFEWCFRKGELLVNPSLGRALIKEPLGRFQPHIRSYAIVITGIVPGGDYSFTIRGEV